MDFSSPDVLLSPSTFLEKFDIGGDHVPACAFCCTLTSEHSTFGLKSGCCLAFWQTGLSKQKVSDQTAPVFASVWKFGTDILMKLHFQKQEIQSTPQPLYNAIVGVQAYFCVSYPIHVITGVKYIYYIGKEVLRPGLPNGCYVTLCATSPYRPQHHLLASRLLHLKQAFSEFMRRTALRVCLFIYVFISKQVSVTVA